MRRWTLCALLVLAACGKSPDRAPAEQGGEATGTPAARPAGTSSASAGAQALLDGLVVPRQRGPLAPHDDCGALPGATEFRRALAAAVLAKDADAIAAMALPTVRLGFGGDDGRKRLRARLAENGGALIGELAALLRLGCAADARGGITIPWYFAQDYGDVDSYSAMLVTGVDVPLRAAADPGSAVRQRLSWELVTLDGGLSPGKPFQQVTTPGGARGFVATDSLRSLLAYRLLATREGGAWKIAALVAGD